MIDYFTFSNIRFGAINRDSGAKRLMELALENHPAYVCITGAHGIVTAQTNPEFRGALQSAALVTPDGTPLAWFAALIGKRGVTRVTGWELILDLVDLDRPQHQAKHFFLGASQRVTDGLVKRLHEQDPGCQVVGVLHPPYRPMTDAEFDGAMQEIRNAGANVVWVGISTPKQELLARRVAEALGHGVVVACGAAFDYVAKTIPTPPRLVSNLGLEWLFRLLSEPRRLWQRYVDIIPKFIVIFCRELATRKG